MSRQRIIKVAKAEAYLLGNWYTRVFREDEVAPEKMELFNKLYKQKIYERRNKRRSKSS